MTIIRTDLSADWTFGLFPLTPVNQIVTGRTTMAGIVTTRHKLFMPLDLTA